MANLNRDVVLPATESVVYFGRSLISPYGSVSGNGRSDYLVQDYRLSKSWVRTPGFWALRRSRARLPDNPFSFELKRFGQGTFTVFGEGVHLSTKYSWTMLVPKAKVARSYSTSAELTQFDLYNRLSQKVRKSNFSLPVTLVEARKTVQMVAGISSLLAGTIHDLRSGNLVSALGRLGVTTSASQRRRFNNSYGRNPTNAAANAWLQYQYGWKPLLNDVKNAAEALAEMNLRSGDDSTASVSASSRLQATQFWPNSVLEVSPSKRGNVRASVLLARKGKWRFKPNAADIPGLFGLVNPFEVVWEVIPFSFVADWFLPIGNYLSALDVPLRVSHVGGSEGYRKHTIWKTELIHVDGPFNIPGHYSGDEATVDEVIVTRSPITSAPVPSIADIRFDPKLNATRATSAIALLWQQAIRLKR